MSTSKNAILGAVARTTGSDKDDVRLHVDMFLAGVGAELAKSKTVNIKHFGIFSLGPDGCVDFKPSPSFLRVPSLGSGVERVITDISADVSEELRMRLLPQADAALS